MTVIERIKADQSKVARYSRAFLLWLSGVAMQVVAVGADTVATWSVKRWAIGFAVAAIMGSAGLFGVGQKNPPAAPTP